MTDQQIKEFVSKILYRISDKSLEYALRRTLFSERNKIDWKDFYNNIIFEMPELVKEVN